MMELMAGSEVPREPFKGITDKPRESSHGKQEKMGSMVSGVLGGGQPEERGSELLVLSFGTGGEGLP